MGFITEFYPENSLKPVRTLSEIAVHYLQTDFVKNLIPLIPFTEIIQSNNCRLLYLVKCIRIINMSELLDNRKFMTDIRTYNKSKMAKICEDPLKANDMDQDHSQTFHKIILYYSFRLLKLASSILLSSYFCGIIFFIFCDLTMHYYDREDAFISHFNLE